MDIKVLGTGCPNCKKIESLVHTAIKELGISADVSSVKDMREIMKYTMSTPALVINGKLRHAGMPLPDMGKIKKIILDNA